MENANWDTAIDLVPSHSLTCDKTSSERTDSKDVDSQKANNALFLIKHAHEYHFYRLVELLRHIDNVAVSQNINEVDGKILFFANPSLGFAPSDVHSLAKNENLSWQLMANFLGLSGAQSPLPSFMIENLPIEAKEGLVRPFFDFFNHRLISLSYQIWRKYRYYLRFEPNATDIVSNQFFALVGLGDINLRGKSAINLSKMLSYAGTLASKGRSALTVAGIIAHCFDLSDVSIKQWVKRKVSIADYQKNLLGKQNTILGSNFVIGEHVTDISGKFTICIKNLSLARFEDFLPLGKEFSSLRTLVEFILREQLAYDLELELAKEETISLHLKNNSKMKLGWNSFLGKGAQRRRMIIQVQQ